MPTVSHASLTADADLHEPKGAAAAAANTVYIADGAGSGSFQNPITALDLVADSNAAINTSFTPVLKFGGTDITTTGGTFSVRTGNFTRVAGLVLCNMRLTLSNKGSSTGAVTIDLPHDNILSGPTTIFIQNATATASTGILSAANDNFQIFRSDGSAFLDSNLNNTSDIFAFCVYGLSS